MPWLNRAPERFLNRPCAQNWPICFRLWSVNRRNVPGFQFSSRWSALQVWGSRSRALTGFSLRAASLRRRRHLRALEPRQAVSARTCARHGACRPKSPRRSRRRLASPGWQCEFQENFSRLIELESGLPTRYDAVNDTGRCISKARVIL